MFNHNNSINYFNIDLTQGILISTSLALSKENLLLLIIEKNSMKQRMKLSVNNSYLFNWKNNPILKTSSKINATI